MQNIVQNVFSEEKSERYLLSKEFVSEWRR